MRIWLAFLNGSKIIENLENGYSLTIYSAQFTTQNNVFFVFTLGIHSWERGISRGDPKHTIFCAVFFRHLVWNPPTPPPPPLNVVSLLQRGSETPQGSRHPTLSGGGGGWGECLAVIRGYFCMPAWGTLTLAVVLEATCVLFLARLPEGTPGSGHCWRELSI